MRIRVVVLAAIAFAATSEKASACAQSTQEANQLCSNWQYNGCGIPPTGSWALTAYASCVANCAQSVMCKTAVQRARDAKKDLSAAPVVTKNKTAAQQAASAKTNLLNNSGATVSGQKSSSPNKLIESSPVTNAPRLQR